MREMLKKPAVFLTALYTIAWSPMLFLRGDYWDGWILVNQFTRPDLAWLYTTELAPQRLYHYYLLARFALLFPDPILVTRVLIFASWLISGLVLLRILRRYLQWNNTEALLLVAYYLVIPTFFVRFELFLVCYSLANMFFLLACYLSLDISHQGLKRFVREIGACLLFILSFLVNSFVIFFAAFLVVHVYLFAQSRIHRTLGATIVAWLKRYWYLLMLPIAFLFVKFMYLQPYGDRSAYNQPIFLQEGATALSTLSSFVNGFWGGMYTGIIWPFANALSLLERKYFAIALALATVLVVFLFRRYSPLFAHVENNRTFKLWKMQISHGAMLSIIGLALCVLALFPYLVVGKTPHIYGYGFGLRHSLLFPLGTALLIYGGVITLVRTNFQKGVHVALLSLCTAFIWYNFFLLDMDWYKQQAIMRELPPSMAEAPPGTLFIFDDRARTLNWLGRQKSRVEYSGYLEMLAGNRSYDGVSIFDFDTAGKAREYDAPSKISVVITSKLTDDPRALDWLHLKYAEIFKTKDELGRAIDERLQIVLTASKTSPAKR